MFCPKCGKEVVDDAVVCVHCGRSVAGNPQAAPAVNVPNYLVQSILVTLFCCLPFGIVSIVYAAKVNNLVAAGDIAGAKEASSKAKTWCWVSFGVGIVFTVIVFALNFLGAIASLV